jgi:hypothetical protein
MDFNVIDSVINAVLFAQEKQFQVLDFWCSGTLPGVIMLLQGIFKSSAQTNLMENTLLKQKTGDVLVFSFVGMAESGRSW